MGIAERRERERERRRREILDAAWSVAASGWAAFSMERVAAKAELGRATIYGYFPSLEALVAAMADEALQDLSNRTTQAQGLAEALDAPVRFSQANPAAFALLFPPAADTRPMFSSAELARLRDEAQQMVRALRTMATKNGVQLPEDTASAEAFLAGIAMAGATVPELRSNTPLRRKWQEFCLSLEPRGVAGSDGSDGAGAAGSDGSDGAGAVGSDGSDGAGTDGAGGAHLALTGGGPGGNGAGQ